MMLALVRNVVGDSRKVAWTYGDSAVGTLPLEEFAFGQNLVGCQVRRSTLYLSRQRGDTDHGRQLHAQMHMILDTAKGHDLRPKLLTFRANRTMHVPLQISHQQRQPIPRRPYQVNVDSG